MKILKHILRPKQRTILRNYSARHQIKASYFSEIKILLGRYTATYRHLLPKCFENAVLRRVDMVQHNFLFCETNQKHVCWKFEVFDYVTGVYFYNVE